MSLKEVHRIHRLRLNKVPNFIKMRGKKQRYHPMLKGGRIIQSIQFRVEGNGPTLGAGAQSKRGEG